MIHDGELTHYIPQSNTYVYFRHDADDSVMVVLNNAEEERTLDLARFEERLQGYNAGQDVIGGESVTLEDSMTVPPKTPMVLELGQ